jgi:hypothetical protein
VNALPDSSVPPSETLVIVPADAAGIRSGVASASAFEQTSTRRWLVSTLPPATAKPAGGSTSEPGSVTISMGSKSPSLVGTRPSIRHRSA